ncbi:NUDIX hydrolase [Ruminococcus sp.]|uniref:NUDIX hydrolase n=1 Tax=Ruminococcus sp. TaxID=41978 RepID=UPI002B6FE885|nr:NUDIX hydrolase [Ruminococcus sp.]HNZ98121.1 NUDIX hydrolase [Ruminococcus sp.]HOH86172.1 NUDIX hydrolase [Ruminococcus sp.]
MSNRYYTVCGILDIDGRILFVRHTYGAAKERILIPGGYVKEGELPSEAVKRELMEETGVVSEAESVFAVQFRKEQWIIVFRLRYISGEPESDGYENSEVLLLKPEEAVKRSDITNMSRAILNAYIKDKNNSLEKECYNSISLKDEVFEIFGV